MNDFGFRKFLKATHGARVFFLRTRPFPDEGNLGRIFARINGMLYSLTTANTRLWP